MPPVSHNLERVARAFDLRGDWISAEPYGNGHINDTYAACCCQAGTPVRYILQRINHHVFADPPSLMENVRRVTDHQRMKLAAAGTTDTTRRALTLVPTHDGAIYHADDDGNTWRAYLFIEQATTYDEITRPEQAYQAARAFGQFMGDLADLPGGPLSETIPEFHHTRSRFDALQVAIDADAHGRAASVRDAIAFAHERESMVDVLLDFATAGGIPVVTTHNDTKLNNVMLDDATGEGICVIDLDTVMPGLALYDFGDMARTALRPCPEDETDLSNVVAQVDMFEAITRGYLSTAGNTLNATELDHMVFAARLITFEIGMRFLTDYLQGDPYFKTHRDAQNRDRCHVQFKMVESIEQHQDELEAIVRSAR